MNNKEYRIQKFNKRKQLYRIYFGLQQFINYPLLNLMWLLGIVVIVFLVKGKNIILSNFEPHPFWGNTFRDCINLSLFLLVLICGIEIIKMIGNYYAQDDEATLEEILGEEGKIQPALLVYKKKDKKTGVIKTEFYTIVSMNQWQKHKKDICDKLNMHLVRDIEYGGKNHNIGNRIYFEYLKNRIPPKRGELYDETL